MIQFIHFQQALLNLSAAKWRSGLAVLGILVGTAATVALMSCGQLATEMALEQFRALGTNLLSISLYSKSLKKGSSTDEQLTLKQWRKIPDQIVFIEQMAPYGTSYQPIRFAGKPLQAAILGADESLAKIIHIQLERGHFVSFLQSSERFCVIGHEIAQQLQTIQFADLIGKPLQIGQNLYTIIGIAKPWKENGFFSENINRAVIVPIAGLAFISPDSKINQALFQLKKDSPIDAITSQLQHMITREVPTLSIFTRSAKQIIESMETQGRIFTLLLAVIGGISLIVGGIGVMNVMLVSVSERKKEIGIRKAIGAKNKEIQILFLTESVVLSLLGGFFGVLLGLLLTWLISYFSGWAFTLFLTPPLIGFVVSAATGIFFGFYPARRAAKLDPILSLQSS